VTPGRRPKLRPIAGFPPSVQLIGIGWYVALCIILGVVGGVFLDKWIDTKPVFTLLGLLLGMIMAFWGGWVQLKEVLDAISTRGQGDKPK
jgi:F0F1-type ATP synthase assembly protein I